MIVSRSIIGILRSEIGRAGVHCETPRGRVLARPHIPPKISATVKMSLSPRPHMFITIR